MKLNKGIVITLLALATIITAFIAGTIGSKFQTCALGEMTAIPQDENRLD